MCQAKLTEKGMADRKRLAEVCNLLSLIKYHEDRNDHAESINYINLFNDAVENYLHPDSRKEESISFEA
jgi:hypothetical protein